MTSLRSGLVGTLPSGPAADSLPSAVPTAAEAGMKKMLRNKKFDIISTLALFSFCANHKTDKNTFPLKEKQVCGKVPKGVIINNVIIQLSFLN